MSSQTKPMAAPSYYVRVVEQDDGTKPSSILVVANHAHRWKMIWDPFVQGWLTDNARRAMGFAMALHRENYIIESVME